MANPQPITGARDLPFVINQLSFVIDKEGTGEGKLTAASPGLQKQPIATCALRLES